MNNPAGLRVLVVDDNVDAAEAFASLLRMAGHEAKPAYSARETIKVGEVFCPHVVVLDISLPDMSGYELVRTLRGLPWGRGAKFIAVTGWAKAEDEKRALRAGFDYYLVKPIELARLEALLASERSA